MHATAHVHQLIKMDSAKSYHKESIQSSSNREGRGKKHPKCLYQSRGVSEQHLHFHLSVHIICPVYSQSIFKHLHI